MAAAWLNLSDFGIWHSQIHRWWSVELSVRVYRPCIRKRSSGGTNHGSLQIVLVLQPHSVNPCAGRHCNSMVSVDSGPEVLGVHAVIGGWPQIGGSARPVVATPLLLLLHVLNLPQDLRTPASQRPPESKVAMGVSEN